MNITKLVGVIGVAAVSAGYSGSPEAADYYGSGWYRDAGIGLYYDDNVSRAMNDSDIEEDFISSFSAGMGYRKKIGNNQQLVYSASLQYEHYYNFDDLDNIGIAGRAVYTIQPDPGYSSPWYDFDLQIEKLEFNGSAIRDSVIVSAGISAGKRLGRNLAGNAGYYYTRRFADGSVFDTGAHNLGITLDYQYSRKVSLYAGYSFKVGDSVSTATPNPGIYVVSKAVAPDDVFAPGSGTECVNRRCAYRLDVVSHSFKAGMVFDLGSNFSFSLSSRYSRVYGDGDNYYYDLYHQAGFYIQF